MQQWFAWQPDIDLLVLLPAAWLLYVFCWIWLRRNRSHAISIGRLVCWSSGLLVISIATMSSIDTMADSLFFIHMLQHILLIDLAPPLLLLGRPFSMGQALFARKHTGHMTEMFPMQNTLVKGTGLLLKPAVAWIVSTITLCVWHVPWFYNYALVHPNVHEFGEHLTLFLAFLIWWHPLIGSIPRFPYLSTSASRFFYLVASMIPSVLLGALILFWPDILYTYYLNVPRIAGISAAFDQQLGALVMLSGDMAVLFIMGLPLQYYKTRRLSWP